ncbi:MAG TPA: glycoside hydrolase family 3 N-terminal domain-containing protein, partial [Ferruginibacter sp.]|nr:glycoside hydrolase family 3 N-terminal domain-containing protein [Ferruginibacter sp.]
MRYRLTLCLLCFSLLTTAQKPFAAYEWADSVYRSLTDSQRIGQLIVARLSAIDLKTRKITFYDSLLTGYVDRFNIGGLCLFQGSPTRQVEMVNALQARARTPILVSMDAEWGVGMRLGDSVMPLPKQMMLGATGNEALVYAYGKQVAAQCRRMGIRMNYAPVVDVNNNPNNPVINDRSFGENKQLVTKLALQYMKGLQESGVMACAKHFPGHGDVAVDSHLDLPVILKSRPQLDSLELAPFRALIASEVASVMVAHLFIPSIDDRANRPSSLSQPAIDKLLHQELKFAGLTITDALEMQGVKKFFPDGEASVESIKAGNDMLCLPENIPVTVSRILQAIEKKELRWEDIERHAKKILLAKYQYGLTNRPLIATENLVADLNQGLAPMRRQIAEQAITLLSHQDAAFFPLKKNYEIRNEVAYVGIGINSDNAMAARLRQDFQATTYYVDPANLDSVRIGALLDSVVRQHRRVIIGLHNMSRSPASNFGITAAVFNLVNQLQQQARCMTFIFGNPYAARNWCYAANLAVCYDDDTLTQQAAVDLLEGKLPYHGTLPVRVCENFPAGSGVIGFIRNFPEKTLAAAGMNADVFCAIDS